MAWELEQYKKVAWFNTSYYLICHVCRPVHISCLIKEELALDFPVLWAMFC